MLRGSLRISQEGDTLIEVIFAVAIFSAVAVGTVMIMNQGVSSAQNALEINLVRNQIDTQAELLRHLNSAKLTAIGRNSTDDSREWDEAISGSSRQASQYAAITTVEQCRIHGVAPPGPIPSNAFYISPLTGKVERNFNETVTFAQIQQVGTPLEKRTESNMLWVEPVESTNDASGDKLPLTRYFDFHIRACWESPGAAGGLMKLGTIVRLYVPEEG